MIKELKEITFELTNKCNLRCRICNIWKEKNKSSLSFDDIGKVLKQFKNQVSVSLTGGEPLLNPEIERIYKYLFRLFLQKRIKNIDIASNGYSNELLKFVEKNKNYLAPLSLSISLDGIEKIHNSQRGRDDAFKKTLNNILAIKKYNIPVTIKFVISKINFKDLIKVYMLTKRINASLNIKFFEVIPNYYHRQYKIQNLSLSKNSMLKIKNDIKKIGKMEKNNKSNFSFLSLRFINKYLDSNNLGFIRKCLTPECSLFVTCHGEIYNCIYLQRIGSLKSWPNINKRRFKINCSLGKKAQCPKCLSYHGFLKEFNMGIKAVKMTED